MSAQSGERMSRRDCVRWLGRATLASCALELCGHSVEAGDKDKRKGSDAPVVNLMSLPNGKALEAPGGKDFILTRTNDGIAALSTFCTHRRNRLALENGVISCPVHGSEFDLDGKPLNGPATRPLAWYAVNVDEDGNIRVDTSRQVAEGSRAALPSWARPVAK